jgi:hypothetical protein
MMGTLFNDELEQSIVYRLHYTSIPQNTGLLLLLARSPTMHRILLLVTPSEA